MPYLRCFSHIDGIVSIIALVLTVFMTAMAATNVSGQATAFPGRERISLDGVWSSVTTPDRAEKAPEEGWEDYVVPSINWMSPNGGSRFLWLKKEINIPSHWEGCRVFVNLRGARYAPHLFIDGRLADSHFDGLSPLLAEITDFINPGATHQLELRCQDRGVFFPENFVWRQGEGPEALRGKVLSPIGGYKENVGPWDDVWLECRPTNYISDEDLVITPSVRKKRLRLSGKVRIVERDAQIGAVVYDGERSVLTLPSVSFEPDGAWSLETPFPDARCWSPETPFQYRLVITLRAAGETSSALDVLETQFGFKEFWAEGPDFYLNGVKRHLLASSTWPLLNNESNESYDTIREKLRVIKEGGVNAFRLHIGPWQEDWIKAADEVGVMIIAESAAYTDETGFYAYQDDRFWENFRRHIAGMIRRDRNHASLIMWSLGNEILFMGNQRYDPNLPQKLGDLGRYAKSVDPYHLITFEADLDPDGAYDVIGLHYPHEPPRYFDYPNTCDWLASRIITDAAGGMLGQQSSVFYWERKKPLYIGEYLWVPMQDHSVASIFFGDDAYLNRDAYHQRAQAQAFIDQTIAYRRSGVSGTSPWSVFGFGGTKESDLLYEAQKRFYRPVAAFLRNRGLRGFAGETHLLAIDVFNDSDSPHEMKLQVTPLSGSQALASTHISLPPGAYSDQRLSLQLPGTQKKLAMNLSLELVEKGKALSREEFTITVYPRQKIEAPEGFDLFIFDPSGKWPDSQSALASLANAEAAKTILIITPGALNPPLNKMDAEGLTVIGSDAFDARSVLRFLDASGRALVLEQESLAPLALDLSLAKHQSTMTFPLRHSHPVLANLDANDLMFWRNDNYVALNQIKRPSFGGARAITVSGGPDCLAQAPIVEMPVGAGRLIFMQTLCGAKRDVEPVANTLINNAIQYLASDDRSSSGSAMVLGGGERFLSSLQHIGLAFSVVNEPLTTPPERDVRWLLLDGGDPLIAKSQEAVAQFVQSGGSIYWRAPEEQAYAALRDALGLAKVKMEQLEVSVSLADREHPLLSGISREDLYFASSARGSQRARQVESNVASRVFIPEADSSTASNELDGAAYPEGVAPLTTPSSLIVATRGKSCIVLDGIEWIRDGESGERGERYANALFANLGMPFEPPRIASIYESIPLDAFQLQGESPYSELGPSQILLRSAGEITAPFYCAESGMYSIRLEGKSTAVQKVYGIARVAIDGNEIGQVEFAADASKFFDVDSAMIEAGKHELTLEFINDEFDDSSDRNLWIDEVALSRD